MQTTNLQGYCNHIRAEIQKIADDVLLSKKSLIPESIQDNEDRAEVMANLMLAYRHLEDAKMRMGKVIQAVEGVSVYDTPANK